MASDSTAAQAAPPDEVRLLVLCAGDPDNERTFSGSARSLIRALEKRGVVHAKANVLGWSDPFGRGSLPVRAFRRLDRFGIERRYRYSRRGLRANSARGRRAANRHPGFNACFMYGTNFDPRLPVPTYCYFDATVAQVAGAGGWSYAHLPYRTIARMKAYQRGVFEHCTGIFPRTEYAARSVRDDYGIPAGKVHPAGAGPNHFVEPLAHAPYDNRTILFVGSEWDRKGGPLIAEAFALLRERMPDARLRIVGCRPQLDAPGVDVIGRISKDAPGGLDRLMRMYSEAALFCIMSAFEPFGIVVLEAQNSFVPCVVPPRFAFTETVLDGETGAHVARDDARLLADTFERLLADPERLRAMGDAGHAFVRREWTWERAAERIHSRIAADLAGGAAR